MSITLCIEARSPAEDEALHSEHAPELNVHNARGCALLVALGINPDCYGTHDAADLVDRIDAATTNPRATWALDPDYIPTRLPLLRTVAITARLRRQVVWG